jgi:hypothetical protein
MGSLSAPWLLSLPQHAHEHRPERSVRLAVDQQLGEGAALLYPLGTEALLSTTL